MMQNNVTEDNTEYLICLIYADQIEEIHEWSIITGQMEAYEFLKEVIVESGLIDLKESFILKEDMPFKHRQPIYNFIRYIKDLNDHDDDVEFDIDDYL